jgi:HEAT repeat protein
MATWRSVALICGLTDVKEEPEGTLEGYREDLRVRFGSYHHESRNRGTYAGTLLQIEGAEEPLVPLTLRRKDLSFWGAPLVGHDIETGDDVFDRKFHVTGPSTFVRAILDADVRRSLLALFIETKFVIAGGRLRAEVPFSPTGELHHVALTRALPPLLDVCRRLRRPDMVEPLARNAEVDPADEVRLRNLITLIREHPDHPRTEQVLLTACADRCAQVRVRAAIALGDRGLATLRDVAEGVDDVAAARAIGALGTHLGADMARDILGHALRTRELKTAGACLVALGHRGGRDALGLLAKVMNLEEGELAVAAAEALAATGLPGAEPPLVAGLARATPALRLAAAQALGRVGSASAVLPLKEVEARHAGEAGFRRAAREAIAQIQARLPGASPGQVSLAADEAGKLSLVEDERGRLSLPHPDEH